MTLTRRSGSANGSGRSATPLITLKIALVAPMPTASVRTATIVNPGAFRNWRIPYRISVSTWASIVRAPLFGG
jgi:hypothetical protein